MKLSEIKLSTMLMILLPVAALVVTTMACNASTESEVSPAAVTAMMLGAAALFAITAVIGLRGTTRASRFFGVAAAAAAIFLLVVGLLFFQVISTLLTEPPPPTSMLWW